MINGGYWQSIIFSCFIPLSVQLTKKSSQREALYVVLCSLVTWNYATGGATTEESTYTTLDLCRGYYMSWSSHTRHFKLIERTPLYCTHGTHAQSPSAEQMPYKSNNEQHPSFCLTRHGCTTGLYNKWCLHYMLPPTPCGIAKAARALTQKLQPQRRWKRKKQNGSTKYTHINIQSTITRRWETFNLLFCVFPLPL